MTSTISIWQLPALPPQACATLPSSPLLAACSYGGTPCSVSAALTVLPLAVWAQRKLRRRVSHHSRDKVDRREAMVSLMAEACQNAAVVKGAGLEQRWFRSFCRCHSDGFRQSEVALETYQSAIRSSASVVVIATQYGFFVAGALLVIYADLAIGDFLGQLLLINRLTAPMNGLLEYASTLSRSEAALHR